VLKLTWGNCTHNGLPLTRERRRANFAMSGKPDAPLFGLQRLVMRPL
jgi:hypothetical protein